MDVLDMASLDVIMEELDQPWAQPYVHPNGFIQFNLTEDRKARAHFWGHPDIPKQKVATPIHDHVYSFESRCLKGRLFNIRNRFVSTKPDTHEMYEWSQEARALVPHGGYMKDGALVGMGCAPVPRECLCMTPDTGMYREELHEFHETVVDRPTITLVRELGRSRIGCAKPRILVPIGQEPDNDFDRNTYSVDDLKRIMKEIANG